MKNILTLFILVILQFVTFSCTEQNKEQAVEIPLISVKTTQIVQGDIEKFLELNGKTVYLKKNKVVSPISAYVVKVNVQFGDKVQKGAILFELQTKENKALNSNMGDIKVYAPSSGTVGELIVNQPGTYLVEGDLICTIIENSDLMIQVNVPFQYHSLLNLGIQSKIFLPDYTSSVGRIVKILPAISETDQTQTVYLKTDYGLQLPENLNVTARFVLDKHTNSLLIAKDALMSNEKLTEFWVMKIIKDSLALKIPIQKGIENDSLVEVFSNELKINDIIIDEGAYGLPDSSIVKIIK